MTVLITTGQAAGILGVAVQGVRKLLGAGLLQDHRRPGTAQARVDLDEVAALAAWPALAAPAIVAQVAPGRPCTDPDRPWVGWGGARWPDLTDDARAAAWTRWWPWAQDADVVVAGLAVAAAVSGFIPAGGARRIRGIDRNPDGQAAFVTEPLDPDEAAQYERHRIRAARGHLIQLVGGVSPGSG